MKNFRFAARLIAIVLLVQLLVPCWLLAKQPSGLQVRPDSLFVGQVNLWGSEAIVTPLLGIIKDGVNEETLPHPGASVVYRTPEKQIRVVPTFGGSLFAALFPLLF